MADLYGQNDYDLRLDWGPVGAATTGADVTVVVDVLSFSTSVTVAVDRGMTVFPYRWRDQRAEAFAAERDAVLAVGRLEALTDGSPTAPSLSPAGLLHGPLVPRVVLPSPNGSSIATQLHDAGALVVAGCLRNARAVSEWLLSQAAGRTIAVIAAGERWSEDNSLRPALEDQVGAGAIVSGLIRGGHDGRISPEARSAAILFDALAPRLDETLRACVGGRELTARGFAADVEVAAALDVSSAVPVLRDGAFRAAPPD